MKRKARKRGLWQHVNWLFSFWSTVVFDPSIFIQGQLASVRWKQPVDQLGSWLMPFQIKRICSNWIAVISQDLRTMYYPIYSDLYFGRKVGLIEKFIVELSRLWNSFPLSSNGHKWIESLMYGDSTMLLLTLTWKVLTN